MISRSGQAMAEGTHSFSTSVKQKELYFMRIVKSLSALGTRMWKRRGTLSVCASALSLVCAGASASPASAEVAANGAPLSGTGSSFAAPAIATWVHSASSAPYSLTISYTPSNSGTGRFEFTNQTTDWAVSDIGYVGNTDTTPPSFPFNFIPITAGGIAFMYNVPGLTKPLQLTSRTACALLTGGITNWNSPDLATDNPGVTLPNLPVIPVTENDSAGTNYVLEEWCVDEQPALWKAFVQAQEAQSGGPSDGVALSPTAPNSNWPGIHGGLDTSTTVGVASGVQNNAGAIGPVQVKYATDAGFNGSNPAKNVALVQNASGDFTGPTPVYDVSSALAYATQLPNGTHQLNFNGLGPHVYNPSTYSYLLTPTSGWPATKGQTMSQFVDYVLTLGQQSAPSFGYASLGLSLEQYGINAVQTNVPGAVAPTAAEENARQCGDLTPTEVAAGQTTPTCGVVTATAAPPSATSGVAKGAPVTSPAGGVPASPTTAGGTPSTGATSPTTKGSTATGTKTSTGSKTPNSSSGSSLALGSSPGSTGSDTVSSSAGSVDPAVSLSGVAAMPNTGSDPVPLTAVGAGLLVVGYLGRRRILNRRRGAVR
jgi:phosphate transport system substrate-binding protein